ncbi:IPT/TIG domain-containing protein [Streptomyces platensis]|uniref:IPT/TIG domain-containing protein n=1 Tax=Streptomyces platensis TaxID=58346 RepID=UPI00368F5DE3
MPISPNQGSTGGGFAATLTGTGLAGATVVRFRSKPATITASSPTSVSVVAPREPVWSTPR